MAEQPETIKPEIPAWRLELNEKLRAIKAKKESDSLNNSPVSQNSEAKNIPPPPTTNAFKSNLNAKPEIPKPKIVNPVVEKALIRARRANENAIRASIPRIESARSSQAAAALALDKEATARKLEQSPLPEEKVFVKPELEVNLKTTELMPQNELIPQEALKPIPVAEHTITYLDDDLDFNDYNGRPDPLDYIYAEVGKSGDASQSIVAKMAQQLISEPKNQMAFGEIPDLFTHCKIAFVDFATIALSCVPFFALMKLMGSNFTQPSTLLVGLGLAVLLTTFYLVLTQSLCGKTFGMMVSRTHVVDAATDDCPTLGCLTVRTLGYFISFAAALAGFFWVAVDSQHRGWHDLISHTVVVRDK